MATYSVYYMNSEFFRYGLMGYDRLKCNNLLPDPDGLTKTHVFLKLIEARNLEQVYFCMQGEDWCPTGEARKFAASKGLLHTSMSVSVSVFSFNECAAAGASTCGRIGKRRRDRWTTGTQIQQSPPATSDGSLAR
jgi:hypothetical protein